MGAFLGLAACAVMALIVVLGLVVSGRSLGMVTLAAALPNDANAASSQAVGTLRSVDETSDHVLGAKHAKVTLIEYADFQCPYCLSHEPTLRQILKDFPQDVRLVYRHYPLPFHEHAQDAAEAAECAAKLGGNDAFWKMHDRLFDKSAANQLSIDTYVVIAKDIGIDETAFKTCITSGQTTPRVNADASSGNDAGVQGTPTTFVNGKLLSGATAYATLKTEIQKAGGRH